MKLLLAILFTILVLIKLPAQSVYNPNVLPLGDKEALMANTGTGGLSSTGAVYYNPGALTMLEGNSFSLSGSAYLRFRFEGKPIANIAGTNLNYEGNGFRTIPTSVIGVRQRGDWYLGFSVLVPMEFTFEGQQDWNIPVSSQELNLKLLQNYQEKLFLAGLTVARSLGKGWSAGITLYGQTYTYLSTIDLRGSLSESPDAIVQATRRERRAPVDLLLIGGIHRRWNKWNLGLRIAAPSINLFGTGDYYDFSYNNLGGPGNVMRSETDIADTGVKFLTPLDLRVGAVHHPNESWQLALDIAYRFPLRYIIFDDEQLDQEDHTQGNFRINGGFEYRFKDNMALYGGASYTPTTLEETDETFGQNFWGLFAGGKLFTEHIETGIGLFFTRGKGEGKLAVGEGSATQLYEYLGAVLGTNYRF